MNSYDKTKIHRLVAWKGDHFVYEYDKDQEIKFSKFDFLMGYKNAKEKSFYDYQTCKKFFGQYLLETKIVTSPNHRHIALIQPRISGRFLKIKDLKNEIIRRQFKEILDGYLAMLKAGNDEVDLIGQDGVFSRCLSNIFITKENKLIIFDATIMDIRRFNFFEKPFLFLLAKFAKWRQDSNLKAFQKELAKYE
jgi:hypothetical protein